MKILHTSDWHLGASDSDVSLYEDQKCFIDEICEITIKENIGAVVIAGDVYDRSVSSADAIKLYDYAMTKLCAELGKNVIVIAGNHDSPARIEDCRRLLEPSGLNVRGSITDTPAVVSIDDTDFYLMPWFTEEKVKGLYPDRREDIHTLTDAYSIVCEEAVKTFVPGRKHIAVAHAFVTGSETSGSDRAAGIAAVGNAMQVDAKVFEDFDYTALGHIHGPQNIGKKIRYSGTPMAYSFGKEEKQDKSVTIIDTSSMEIKTVSLHPLNKRTTLRGTFDELIKADYDEDVKKGYVRLEVTDSYVGFESIAMLRNIYPKFIEVSGKSYEGEDSGIRMSISEFREMEHDPKAIFVSFCRDIINEDPDEHLTRLFEECVESEGDNETA